MGPGGADPEHLYKCSVTTPGPKVHHASIFWDQLPDIIVAANKSDLKDLVHQGY